MKNFQSAAAIQANASVIWKILTDAPAYASWNTTVNRVDGRIALGEKVTVHVKINPGRAFAVTVTEFTPERRMVWTGGMPLKLFKGERTFTLTPGTAGSVEFQMKEVYSGLMSRLIVRSIPDLQPAFDEFATCLKREAER